jgi:hypothetical protein
MHRVTPPYLARYDNFERMGVDTVSTYAAYDSHTMAEDVRNQGVA